MMLAHGIRGGCWWYSSRGWTFPPIFCYFCCHVTDGSREVIRQNGVWHGSMDEAQVCHWMPPWRKMVPIDIHWCFLNERDQTVDVSTVRLWVVHVRIGNNYVKDKPCSRWPNRAVTSHNEKHLDQLIHVNQWIMTRKLCTEMNMSFSILEIMVSKSEYCKVWAR